MQKYENLKKGTKAGLIVSLVLIALSTGMTAFNFIKLVTAGSTKGWAHALVSLVLMAFIWLYALVLYKKPHGNALRYMFFAFGLCVLANVLMPGKTTTEVQELVTVGCSGLAAMLSAYIGGRLNKIQKNKYLLVLTGVVLLVAKIFVITSFSTFKLGRTIGNLTQLFCWIALCAAYVARFEEHSAAGLEEKNS